MLMCSIVILKQKDERAKEIAKAKEEEIRRDLNQKLRVLRQSAKRKLVHTLEGEKVKATLS